MHMKPLWGVKLTVTLANRYSNFNLATTTLVAMLCYQN